MGGEGSVGSWPGAAAGFAGADGSLEVCAGMICRADCVLHPNVCATEYFQDACRSTE